MAAGFSTPTSARPRKRKMAVQQRQIGSREEVMKIEEDIWR
jgi:hypothetical protein